ncbi:Predicted acetyltransferase [Clostridium collagenovorans DSM 3089]|uniref:Predicted acetyltransferase n=1 Tax=Clostridium collagenovorans DSM 3089 TaxID=1121306 RepID=A0A1M5S6L0_9CLOT|nr:GNAT family N-acetyltransferase [Clostridium collagenovorans]SHH33553.1 Predicted acetyltransferase [Clostridium collagenovorans DSM 3089]
MLELIPRNPSYMKGYKEYCQEFWDNNITWFKPTNPINIDANWFERTADWYSKKEKGLIQGCAKSFHYWAVDDDKFIGEFQLRPELDDELMMGIGSVGYSVRVSEWGKGYGKEILKQGLEIAKEFHLERVLLTINDDNVVSSHICEMCGGRLMDKVTVETEDEGVHVKRRYWIYL